jgi:hypothetical protein
MRKFFVTFGFGVIRFGIMFPSTTVMKYFEREFRLLRKVETSGMRRNESCSF